MAPPRLSAAALLADWNRHARLYERREVLEAARDQLAEILEDVSNLADAYAEKDGGMHPRDAFVKALLRVWKDKYFTWVNEPPCPSCGSAKTTYAGSAAPNEAERNGDASRVEVYRCTACGHDGVRFPRFNDPVRLLQPDWRKGRCGEFANAFTLALRALGFEHVRWVLDHTDHVWTEYWSDSLKRWIHCDSCEAAFDEPHIYSEGWKKQLGHVFGFGLTGIMDVARRYIKGDENYSRALGRRAAEVSEAELARTLAYVNSRIRLTTMRAEGEGITSTMARGLASDLEEILEMFDGRADAASTPGMLRGRTSGALGWRVARGEAREDEG